MKINEIADSKQLAKKWNERRIARFNRIKKTMRSEKGLITPRQAAVLLSVEPKAVSELIAGQKLKRFNFLGHKYLSFREVLAMRSEKA